MGQAWKQKLRNKVQGRTCEEEAGSTGSPQDTSAASLGDFRGINFLLLSCSISYMRFLLDWSYRCTDSPQLCSVAPPACAVGERERSICILLVFGGD